MASSSLSSSSSSNYVITSKTIIIDSKDRDMQLFPDAASYELPLLEEIQDVTTLELLSADVPMASYIVTTHNNQIVVTCDASPIAYIAYLDVGDYTPMELAQEVQAKLNIAVSSLDLNLFRVTYATRTDNYIVRCKRPFALYFEDPRKRGYPMPNGAARVLGFGAHTYASHTSIADDALYPQCIQAPFRRDFTSDRYAILHIDPAYVNYNPMNNAIDKSFAIIPRDSMSCNITSNETNKKEFKPPVAKFAKVRITFLDTYGEPYDFQNRDHRLELRFSSIRQKKYTQQTGITPYIIAPFEGILSER
jgi:hypothetical protein